MNQTGLLLNPVNPNDAIADDIFLLGGEPIKKVDDLAEQVPFKKERQGAIPFCVTFDYLFRLRQLIHKEKGEDINLSDRAMGVETETTKSGNYAYKVADWGKNKGGVLESVCPFPNINNWTWNDWNALFKLPDLSQAQRYFGGGYSAIMPYNRALMRQKLAEGYMLGVAMPLWGETWNKDAGEVVQNGKGNPSIYHMATITGFTEDGVWFDTDSLQPQKRLLAPDYQFAYVQVLGALPENWKTEQKKTLNEEFKVCITDHYNKPRLPYNVEQELAVKLRKGFEKFSNPIVRTIAGRFWQIYCPAFFYGGYNFEYYKWGKWYPGDLLNDAYYYSKTQKHIFNFNKLRSDQ